MGYSDEIGFDDVDGMDDEIDGMDEIGRLRRGQRRRLARLAQSNPGAARRLASGRGATEGRNLVATGQRREYLPFSGTAALAAAAASVATLSVTCQKAFQPERLIVSIVDVTTGADQTGSCTVTQLEIGADNQFVASGEMPAAAYAPNAIGSDMVLDPLGPGITATLEVTRRAVVANAGVVMAGFIGPAAQ